MVATTVLDTVAPVAVIDSRVEPGRPDVGVILTDGDARRAIDIAVRRAAASGGDVCIMRYLDNIGIRSADPLIRRSEAARSQLARIVTDLLGQNVRTRFTERLHIGTLESLLRTLESSVGIVVIPRPADPAARRSMSQCPVPVCFVGPDGELIVQAPIADDDQGA